MWKAKDFGEDSFAMKMMRKQGWKEGQGLGKEGQGNVEPLRPTLKFDNSGIGHDPSKTVIDNPHEAAYNEALKGIDKKKKLKKAKKNEKIKKTMGFVQTETLTNGLVEKAQRSDSDSDSDEESSKMEKLSDQDLFEACGRVTAHK